MASVPVGPPTSPGVADRPALACARAFMNNHARVAPLDARSHAIPTLRASSGCQRCAGTQNADFDVAQLSSLVDAQFADADAARADAFDKLSRLRTARANVLARQRADLGKTPAADRAKALDTAIANAHTLSAGFAGQAVLIGKPVPQPMEGEGVVHGVVHGATGATKLSLADDKGNVAAATTSAKDGYFVLHYKRKGDAPHHLELRAHDPRHTSEHLSLTEPVHFVVVRLRG